MVARCCERVQHCNDAAEVTCVIRDTLAPDEHLDKVDPTAVPDPESRCPSSISQGIQPLRHLLLKHSDYPRFVR